MDTTRRDRDQVPLRDTSANQLPDHLPGRNGFMRSSEFWLTAITGSGLMIAASMLDTLDAPRVALMITVLTTGYSLSRGIATVGTAHLSRSHLSSQPATEREPVAPEHHGTPRTRDGDSDSVRRIETRLDRLERATTGRVTL